MRSSSILFRLGPRSRPSSAAAGGDLKGKRLSRLRGGGRGGAAARGGFFLASPPSLDELQRAGGTAAAHAGEGEGDEDEVQVGR